MLRKLATAAELTGKWEGQVGASAGEEAGVASSMLIPSPTNCIHCPPGANAAQLKCLCESFRKLASSSLHDTLDTAGSSSSSADFRGMCYCVYVILVYPAHLPYAHFTPPAMISLPSS